MSESPPLSRNRDVRLLCRRTLRRLLAGAKGKPVSAVYLWGSIVRPDFDPERSDIDTLLIGEGPDLEETCCWLSLAVTESQPVLRQFKARSLYLEDLNGGPPQSELARLIHPRILLADFENWWWVLGRQFARNDFGLKPGSLDEILTLRLEALRRRLCIHHDDPTREPARYILKELVLVCHVLHQLRAGPHTFSYPALAAQADERTREVVTAIVTLREIQWEEEACRTHLDLVKRFLDDNYIE